MRPRASPGALPCYLCGQPSSGPPDHVPPQLLFCGFLKDYRVPPVLAVPSCPAHNGQASDVDEVLAWILLSGAIGNAALDVERALSQPLIERLHSHREFVDTRLAHSGTRVFRDAKDYDELGEPKRRVLDAEYIDKVETKLRKGWGTVKQGIGKISAGIFHHATERRLWLGVSRVETLRIVIPSFKQCEPTVLLTPPNIDEAAFFAEFDHPSRNRAWRELTSGSPEVFRCRINWQPGNSCRFALRMTFYGQLDVWVSCPK